MRQEPPGSRRWIERASALLSAVKSAMERQAARGVSSSEWLLIGNKYKTPSLRATSPNASL
jgi:hypothetical protein